MLEDVVLYMVETFTAGVVQSCQGQEQQDGASLLHDQDPLEDFRKFNRNDEIFQEYDPPPGDNSKMGWKISRPPTWRVSLWKAMKCAFCMQILGGVALGSLAISILILNLSTLDLCFNVQKTNWTAVSKRYQRIIVTVEVIETFVIQLWSLLLMLTMFESSLIKKLNLITLNLLGASFDTCFRLYCQMYGVYKKSWVPYPLNCLFVLLLALNSLLIGKEIAKNSEESKRIKKTSKVMGMLVAQFAFGIPITFALVYVLIPLYRKETETNRAIIAGALPLVTAAPKVIVRLAAQRIDFLHPGDAHVLLNVLFSSSAIVFRVMQADLSEIRLFTLLSFAHGAIDLLERLTVVIRDYVWYFIYKKFKRDERETILKANQFRSPRSMRFVADMSIQMILGESTSMIAAVGFFQIYKFIYNGQKASVITEFFTRVSIAISIDFAFNSLSFWLQMSYMNVAIDRVWKNRWRKHLVFAFIVTALTMLYYPDRLLPIVSAKSSSNSTMSNANCSQLILES